MDIGELREKVDAVDAELIKLIDRRLKLSRKINRAKRKRGLPLRDREREHEIVRAARDADCEKLHPAEAAEFMETLLEMNRRWVRTRMLGRGVKPVSIAIVGLGLIGGSLAKALKRANGDHRLTGVDLEERLEDPRASGLFAEVFPPGDGARAVTDANFVFLCTPAGRTLELLEQIAEDAPASAVVTDVAGVKRTIVERAGEVFTKGRAYFVGGHPMAGTAGQGFRNSDPDLFLDRPWVLTPGKEDPVDKLKGLQILIESTGAHLQLLLPEDHDNTVSVVSHLPQIAATALMLTVGGRDRGIAGPGLMDTTRLAASPAGMWNELVKHLRERDIAELQSLRAYLTELEIAISFSDPLDKWFNRANKLRRKLKTVSGKGGVAGSTRDE